MSAQSSGKFFIGSIITFVIVFGLVSALLSTMLSVANSVVAPESMAAEDVVARIAPVAQVHVGEAPVAVVAAPVVATSSAGGNGAKTVKAVCALCHNTGMMSSPKLGDAEGWAPRIEKGIDTLYANAINGFNMMPARGGNGALSDDEVKAAVDHMLESLK